MNIKRRENCYVVIGGVGFGKTSLVNWIWQTYGHGRVGEIARDLIAEKATIHDTLLPWKSQESFFTFEQELIDRKIRQFEAIPANQICFADTGIPESKVFFRLSGIEVPQYVEQACRQYRYNASVFFLLPWREIYTQDQSRPQSYDEAVKIGELAREVYRELGYKIIDVSHGSLEDRANFIHKYVAGM